MATQHPSLLDTPECSVSMPAELLTVLSAIVHTSGDTTLPVFVLGGGHGTSAGYPRVLLPFFDLKPLPFISMHVG